MPQKTLNLGILAHVDAGKTTLTERLLYAAGVIDEIGSVDDGSTQTDTLALERQRGITIKSAVVSFPIDDVTVNLIDTPGHPDFIAEVERALSVLDGAVLVVCAVEGVQPQTPLLFRALKRVEVPAILFVNKTDRPGADPARVLEQIEERLTPDAIPIESEGDRAVAMELGEAIPVFFGSARNGAGVKELMTGIAELLPAAPRDGDGPVSGSVFKIERGPAGEKIAYVGMFSGTLRTRDRLAEQKVTAIRVFEDGSSVQRPAVSAGEIAQLWGLSAIQIGDPIGEERRSRQRHFAPPTLETVVAPRDPGERVAFREALSRLAEQDPLISIRQDDDDLRRAAGRNGRDRREDPRCAESISGHRRPSDRARRRRDLRAGSAGERHDAARLLPRRRGHRARDPARGPLRLAGHRLCGHAHAHRLLPAAEPRPPGVRQEHVEHRVRLPEPDAARPDGCAEA